MLYTVTVENFELQLDDHDHAYPPCILFKLTHDVLPSFTFLPEQGSLKWDQLVNAINDNVSFSLGWGASNGDCHIEVKDGYTIFTVAKYGDGCGGCLEIKIPSKICLEAFKKAAEITTSWMNK